MHRLHRSRFAPLTAAAALALTVSPAAPAADAAERSSAAPSQTIELTPAQVRKAKLPARPWKLRLASRPDPTGAIPVALMAAPLVLQGEGRLHGCPQAAAGSTQKYIGENLYVSSVDPEMNAAQRRIEFRLAVRGEPRCRLQATFKIRPEMLGNIGATGGQAPAAVPGIEGSDIGSGRATAVPGLEGSPIGTSGSAAPPGLEGSPIGTSGSAAPRPGIEGSDISTGASAGTTRPSGTPAASGLRQQIAALQQAARQAQHGFPPASDLPEAVKSQVLDTQRALAAVAATAPDDPRLVANRLERLEQSTPKLLESCADGKVFPAATADRCAALQRQCIAKCSGSFCACSAELAGCLGAALRAEIRQSEER